MPRPLAALAAAALSAAAAPAAKAETFTLVTFETPAQMASREGPGAAARYWAPWDALAGRMTQAGVLRGGGALRPAALRVGAGAPRATAQVSGYFTLDVADRAAAEDWARQTLAAGAAAVEVHAQQTNPPMR